MVDVLMLFRSLSLYDSCDDAANMMNECVFNGVHKDSLHDRKRKMKTGPCLKSKYSY